MNRDECVDLNYELSFEYAEKVVELGEVSANYIIGYLYYYGYYVKKDYAKALEYFSKVKNCQNDDTALYILGMMHYYGQGCDVDHDGSLNAYERSMMDSIVFGEDSDEKSYMEDEGDDFDF